MYDFRSSQPEKAVARGHFSALSNTPQSKPIYGHSIASGLATNASGGIQADAAGGPRDVALMRLHFRRRAEADLEEVTAYIARDNPVRAASFVHELRKRCRQLVAFPGAPISA
jgi:hypothetical protein